MTLTVIVFKTNRREVALEYELLRNKQNVRDLQEGIKQATAVHIMVSRKQSCGEFLVP